MTIIFLFSKPFPLIEGKSNITVLDTQIEKLRLKSLKQIREAATRMRNEATDVKATLTEIEDWLDKLLQLSEEVSTIQYYSGSLEVAIQHKLV